MATSTRPSAAVSKNRTAFATVRFRASAGVGQRASTWFTSGKVSGLEACPELAAALPEPISCKLAGSGAVRGRANVEYRVAHDPEWPERYRYVRKLLPDVGCVFCGLAEAPLNAETLVLARDEFVQVVMNKYPYNTGHLLITPLRHGGVKV